MCRRSLRAIPFNERMLFLEGPNSGSRVRWNKIYTFMTDLYQLALKYCEYGSLLHKIMRSHVMIGKYGGKSTPDLSSNQNVLFTLPITQLTKVPTRLEFMTQVFEAGIVRLSAFLVE